MNDLPDRGYKIYLGLYSLNSSKLIYKDEGSEVESIGHRKVEILLKQKRFRSDIHSQDYFNYVDSLVANSRNNFKIVKEDSNLFNLINQASLVIVMPFSSLEHIVGYLNIPSIYFDLTEELLKPTSLPPLGKFISGRPEIIKYLLQTFRSKVKK